MDELCIQSSPDRKLFDLHASYPNQVIAELVGLSSNVLREGCNGELGQSKFVQLATTQSLLQLPWFLFSQGLVSRIFYRRVGRCRAEKERAISGEMSLEEGITRGRKNTKRK
jgi:hypothetical protein